MDRWMDDPEPDQKQLPTFFSLVSSAWNCLFSAITGWETKELWKVKAPLREKCTAKIFAMIVYLEVICAAFISRPRDGPDRYF